jgi:hypothetical protein
MQLGLAKISREIQRLFRQPLENFGYTANRIYHDLLIRPHNIVSQGNGLHSQKIAIYLIFPQKGLDFSHHKTIAELSRNHYRIIAVSNLKLKNEDKEELLKSVNQLIERKNFGYDFAGYREGVLYNLREIRSAQKLVLINDSVIFPIQKTSDWIKQAEQSGYALTGAISAHGNNIKVKTITDQIDPATSRNTRKISRGIHYSSFALMLDQEICGTRFLSRFLGKLRLSNDRANVIRLGEIRLTQAIRKAGFTHGCILTPQAIKNAAEKLGNKELLEILQLTLIPRNSTFYDQLQFLIHRFEKTSADWHRDAAQALFVLSTQFHPAQTLAYFLYTGLEFPFLKKSVARRLGEEGMSVYNLILRQSDNIQGIAKESSEAEDSPRKI